MIGNKVALRPITREDTPLIVQWRNQPSVYSHLFSQRQITAQQHEQWLQSYVDTGKCHQFIIVDTQTDQPVGSVFLKNIDAVMHKAEYGIFIGEESARGKGLGSEAASLMLAYGFETLGLNRIYLSVFTANTSAIASYRHAGFREEGILRQDFLGENGYCDIMLMAVLRAEWLKQRSAAGA